MNKDLKLIHRALGLQSIQQITADNQEKRNSHLWTIERPQICNFVTDKHRNESRGLQ